MFSDGYITLHSPGGEGVPSYPLQHLLFFAFYIIVTLTGMRANHCDLICISLIRRDDGHFSIVPDRESASDEHVFVCLWPFVCLL